MVKESGFWNLFLKKRNRGHHVSRAREREREKIALRFFFPRRQGHFLRRNKLISFRRHTAKGRDKKRRGRTKVGSNPLFPFLMSQLTLRRRKEEEEEAPISSSPLPPLVYYLLRPSFPRRGANGKKRSKSTKKGEKTCETKSGLYSSEKIFSADSKVPPPSPTDTCACTLFLQVVEFSGTDRKLSYYVHSNFIIIFLCSLVRLHAQSNVVL